MSNSDPVIKSRKVFEILTSILPKKSAWRIYYPIKIIAEKNGPISSSEVTRKLNKIGFKTSIASVHPFLDLLVAIGLCERRWPEDVSKKVQMSEIGKIFLKVLETTMNNGQKDIQLR